MVNNTQFTLYQQQFEMELLYCYLVMFWSKLNSDQCHAIKWRGYVHLCMITIFFYNYFEYRVHAYHGPLHEP